MKGRVLVAGLGNVLMSDDAIGPYCTHYLLAHYDFADNVSVVDLGTPGLGLALHLASADVVVAIDAVRSVEPGTVHVFYDARLSGRRDQLRLDTHAAALEESMLIARLAGERPFDVTLVGMGGVDFDHGTRLSQVVVARLGALADRVLTELSGRGVTWRRRAEPAKLQVWWEQATAGPRDQPASRQQFFSKGTNVQDHDRRRVVFRSSGYGDGAGSKGHAR